MSTLQRTKKVGELCGLIRDNYDSEAAMAKKLGWTRQRLNKITTGAHEPDIYEAAALAGVLNISVDGIADIFLRHKSPNGPHINADSMRKDVS